MEHLSQEELLLLADGEVADEGAAHLPACAVCNAQAEALEGGLTAAVAQLRQSAPEETPESHSASWARLRNAIRSESGTVALHLSPEELLLHLDDELAPERALHVESCGTCHDELMRLQALLFDIEHELRALIPAEPRERAVAAAAALEQKLYPPRKVISFPVRWGAVYAAAAAMTFAVFGGLWSSQQTPSPAPREQPLAAAEGVTAPEPAPVTAQGAAEPVEVFAPVQTPAVAAASSDDRATLPERFEMAFSHEAAAPELRALPGLAAPGFSGVSVADPGEMAFDLGLRPLSVAPAPAAATPSPEPASPDDAALLLAGLQAAVRSGAWLAEIAPELRQGRLTFVGQAGSVEQRDALTEAIRREMTDAAVQIAVVESAPSLGETGASYSLGGRPAGGLMRSALLQHYGDAARRSFQQPEASALDGEIARFAGEVYRSQSSLVRHAHALSGLLEKFEPAPGLPPDAARTLNTLVRFHAYGVAEGEARIYGHLSEALPRRYWNHRGDRQGPADGDSVNAARALLSDALRLDETLTTLLGASAASIGAGDAQTSPGALLYRIRTRAKILSSGLDSVR